MEKTSLLRRLVSETVRLCYPSVCRACGKPLENTPTLCRECWQKITLWHGIRCARCGTPSREPQKQCVACPEAFGEMPLRLRVAVHYTSEVRALLHAWKYEQRLSLTKFFVEWILSLEPPPYRWEEYIALVPIPLHRTRQAERGFNQAELLCRGLSLRCGLPVQTRWLRRVRATLPLSRLEDNAQRRKEIAGAFRGKIPHHARKGALLLVDDLVTTGTTIAEAAKTLSLAGAASVDVLAVARAVPLPVLQTTSE